MIDIQKFKEIRQSNHLIVLDTNILLELYRQPANISVDIINALEKIIDTIYIPQQVYAEYIQNYQKVCGSEKKKYKKVCRELLDSVNKLQEDIGNKAKEYIKHNYTDVTNLQDNLNLKIADMQSVIKEYEKNHKEQIGLNKKFLEDDRVKKFVDLLLEKRRMGDKIKFSEKLALLKEGQIRFDNKIPPGYADAKKDGIDKYGDLFVWKNVISVAHEKKANIIFVCNDTKEDWWETKDEMPSELRQELLEEFKEVNPMLQIHFLTLDKFFTYIAEELKLGKSKSALQLSSMKDTEKILIKYKDKLYGYIKEYLCGLDIEEELEEEYIEVTDNYVISWNIQNVSIEKEERNIIYYVDLDISVLSDLTYREPGDYPYYAGEVALVLSGEIEFTTEEYSNTHTFRTFNIECNDIFHIEPEIWKMVKGLCKKYSCQEIITMCKGLTRYQEEAKQFYNRMNSYSKNLQQIFQQNKEIRDEFKIENNNMSKLSDLPEKVELLGAISESTEPLQKSKSNINQQEIAQQSLSNEGIV